METRSFLAGIVVILLVAHTTSVIDAHRWRRPRRCCDECKLNTTVTGYIPDTNCSSTVIVGAMICVRRSWWGNCASRKTVYRTTQSLVLGEKTVETCNITCKRSIC